MQFLTRRRVLLSGRRRAFFAMPKVRELSPRTLAQAFAAGRINADDCWSAAAVVVGKQRWPRGLVQRVIARFGEPFRLRARAVEEFLLADRLFQCAATRWER